jgi:hypothetical protein
MLAFYFHGKSRMSVAMQNFIPVFSGIGVVSCSWAFLVVKNFFKFWFVRLLALRPLLAYYASLGWLWRWLWRSRWNVDWRGKPKFSEKTCPSATFVHKIPHDQTWVWTRAAAVGSWRLTAWAMARLERTRGYHDLLEYWPLFLVHTLYNHHLSRFMTALSLKRQTKWKIGSSSNCQNHRISQNYAKRCVCWRF